MSKYSLQGYPATQEEIARWHREAMYFQHEPPHPRAPQGTAAAKGWGIPRAFAPPVDAVGHVKAMFKRDVAAIPQHEKLRPEYEWSIISVCMAHFLWFRTPAGADWIMRFFGVEERPVFYDAYAYRYVIRNKNTGDSHKVPLLKDGPLELRIFRRTEKVFDPPVKEAFDNIIYEMQEIMKNARNPSAGEPIAEASGDMYFWVSEHLRDWFLESKPNKHWPTENPNRIGGYQWAKTLERKEGQLFYEAIDKVELYKDYAYRIKDRKSGGITWCGGEDMNIPPLPEYFRNEECNRYSEHQVDVTFRCSSCNKVRACTPSTGGRGMCSHCYGAIVQKDDRPALDWCTMKECSRCTAHLSNKSDLANLKNRLNREVHFPVHR